MILVLVFTILVTVWIVRLVYADPRPADAKMVAEIPPRPWMRTFYAVAVAYCALGAVIFALTPWVTIGALEMPWQDRGDLLSTAGILASFAVLFAVLARLQTIAITSECLAFGPQFIRWDEYVGATVQSTLVGPRVVLERSGRARFRTPPGISSYANLITERDIVALRRFLTVTDDRR